MKSFLGFLKLLSAFPPSTPLICHGRGPGSASVLLQSVCLCWQHLRVQLCPCAQGSPKAIHQWDQLDLEHSSCGT